MEETRIILKPSTIGRGLAGEVINRLERKGLIIQGCKMIRLSDEILAEHYAHLVERPFFPRLCASMKSTPVIVTCVAGVDCVEVVRTIVGVTNGRKAAPGTIRGDLSMSGQENIIHASDSVENAKIELARFFKPEEIFSDYVPTVVSHIYANDEF